MYNLSGTLCYVTATETRIFSLADSVLLQALANACTVVRLLLKCTCAAIW